MPRSHAGFTILEMVSALLIIVVLSVTYFLFTDSYRERRMSEQAARVLMMSARAEEDFFAKQHYYFDAEVSGSGGDMYLPTPDGGKTVVQIPPKVVLSLKAQGKDKPAFTGHAFFMGSKVLHKYDSTTGKMTTVTRGQDETG
ncbi:MAG TPA: prepilin-type N-terminal cleavage/methylation domain-containing protein [Desulfomonilaceae bacterium]|nr:prepilin-type N-terminal cleavage/methylation domain-containing protein [Desulfomonilaceae bacterium]